MNNTSKKTDSTTQATHDRPGGEPLATIVDQILRSSAYATRVDG